LETRIDEITNFFENNGLTSGIAVECENVSSIKDVMKSMVKNNELTVDQADIIYSILTRSVSENGR
jgi:hypothetical protein